MQCYFRGNGNDDQAALVFEAQAFCCTLLLGQNEPLPPSLSEDLVRHWVEY